MHTLAPLSLNLSLCQCVSAGDVPNYLTIDYSFTSIMVQITMMSFILGNLTSSLFYQICSDLNSSPDGAVSFTCYRQAVGKFCGVDIELWRGSSCSRMTEKSAIFISAPSEHGLRPTFVPTLPVYMDISFKLALFHLCCVFTVSSSVRKLKLEKVL